MARDFDPTSLILLGVGAYLIWNHSSTGSWLPQWLTAGTSGTAPNYSATSQTAAPAVSPGSSTMMCRTPSGALVSMNADGTCPGGAVPCFPSTFIGPLQPGDQYC